MEKRKPLITKEDFISGAFAGIAQVLVGQPLDLVKVRMQTRGDIYKNPVSAFSTILKNEGVMAFYKGTLSPLMGISFAVATQFSSNELAKRYFIGQNKKKTGQEQLNFIDIVLSGMFSGFFVSIPLTPIELIRIKMQVQGKESAGQVNKYAGTIDCVVKVAKSTGFRGLFQGWVPAMTRETIGGAWYFGVYETLMQKSLKTYKQRELIPQYLVALYGGISGFMLWTQIYPVDVAKTMIQIDDYHNRQHGGLFSTLKHIYATRGFGGLYSGLTPCLIRAPIANAATFLTFEWVNKKLKAFK